MLAALGLERARDVRELIVLDHNKVQGATLPPGGAGIRGGAPRARRRARLARCADLRPSTPQARALFKQYQQSYTGGAQRQALAYGIVREVGVRAA
jgi:hypothetical protein